MDSSQTLLCGITILLTPLYKDAISRGECRTVIWQGDELAAAFKKLLEDTATASMFGLLSQQINPGSKLEIRAEVAGDQDADEESSEFISLELDIFGDRQLFRNLCGIEKACAYGVAICRDLEHALVKFSSPTPLRDLKWKIIMDEYGEQ